MVPGAVKTVAVIGNGLIGHGVAQVFAVAGKDVRLIGRRAESLSAAMGKIKSSLDSFAAYGLVPGSGVKAAMKRIHPTTDMGEASAAELVVEAVPFEQKLQHEVFGELDRICTGPTILASSSGALASELVARVKRRDRVVASHFWYPSQHIPAVEVCAGPETGPDVVPWLCKVLESVGKVPVVLNREIRGFIGNRMQIALLREAWALWASGVASAEMIDTVVRSSFGRRLAITGPIESADVGGLETLYNFAGWLLPGLDRDTVPSPKVGELVKGGAKGPSTGRGVYDWKKRDANALISRRMDELLRWLQVDKGVAKKAPMKKASAKKARARKAARTTAKRATPKRKAARTSAKRAAPKRKAGRRKR
ncbi:MAG: 3-hydroxyacyl-CoA dehydrogenase family protein [Alphaproteobacteria bacterium]